MAALVPDHEACQELPVALDLDLRNGLLSAPVMAYGYCPSEPDGPFSYHDVSMLLRPKQKTVSLGFWLYLDAEARSSASSAPVQEFIWNRARKPEPELVVAPPVEKDDRTALIEDALTRQRDEGVFELPRHKEETWSYDTAEMSEFGRWMLRTGQNDPTDPRLKSACRRYGDFLVARQMQSGAIPQRFTQDLVPVPEQRSNALTAASGRFLMDLYEITRERRYRMAALKAGKFVSGLPWRARYLAPGLTIQDTHTGIAPHRSAVLRAVADLFIALHRYSGEARYLKVGLGALVQMCWYQETWGERIGGFTKGNTEAGKEPAAAFARTLLEYYAVTHRSEHMERALAAMRAGLTDGEAEAAAVQEWAIKTFGYALIDVRGRSVYPIGPCTVQSLSMKHGSIAFEFRDGFSSATLCPVNVSFRGLRAESYHVTINGEGKRYHKSELESGIAVTPKGESKCESHLQCRDVNTSATAVHPSLG